MAPPKVSGKKHQGSSAARHTENLEHFIVHLKRRYCQHMKASNSLWRWLVLKHSSSWHPSYLCWVSWMLKRRTPSTYHATNTVWRKWVAMITQRACIWNPRCPGFLEVIIDWSEEKDLGMSQLHAEEVTLCNKLLEIEQQYALFTDGPCLLFCGETSEIESSCMESPMTRWRNF